MSVRPEMPEDVYVGNPWEDYGSPTTSCPEVRLAACLVADLFRAESLGGGLHIVVYDWNLETEHVQWCIENLPIYGSADPAVRALELAAATSLLALEEEDRAAALGLVEGYWTECRYTGGMRGE
jgi:hypothetical protein